ncbi:hypothetical protein NE857_08380 [Nocardiopsis exhalans]|uniref:Uncharacterized protein n=2 Tax=Nocardiopsis TaxID=2013 RepID=A0A840WVK8_9ACTN|nr:MULTISPECIES: hypothetical protein [Nocardiopsis]MBB5495567.1 hypothetical protein [Nocardiopsis metallicus]QRN79149.1 MAG: hypothetical protein JK586_12395 [Nocardiopsis sp. BM-2018]USY21605.1 hypothetical protein NE857_08380 [Nocardiopsis exhalans]
MSALGIEFTEAESEQIRQTAAAEQRSPQELVQEMRESVLADVRRRRFEAAAKRVTTLSAELNERLAK